MFKHYLITFALTLTVIVLVLVLILKPGYSDAPQVPEDEKPERAMSTIILE